MKPTNQPTPDGPSYKRLPHVPPTPTSVKTERTALPFAGPNLLPRQYLDRPYNASRG